MLGAGAIRANSLQSTLTPLTVDQQELVNRAKQYAMEQSIKSVLSKQSTTNQSPVAQSTTAPTPTSGTSNSVANSTVQQQKSRHQALVLMCRVYVGSISFELKEETIKAAFAPFGGIKSINMSWDPITLKHKGFAFVEYELPEAAQLALEHMNAIQLGGRQIKVGRPSNMPQAAPIIQQIQEECKKRNRIYVSNIHPDLTERELAEVFDPFGQVKLCKLAMTPPSAELSTNAAHKGYGFIEYNTEEEANEALTMDKFEILDGYKLHVCRATTPPECLSPYGILETEISFSNNATTTNNVDQSSTINNATSIDEDIQLQLERTNKEQQENSETSAMNQSSMLDPGLETWNEDNQEKPSNVLILRNMVTADEEIDDALQLDVYEECKKYGPVSQVVIFVEKAKKSKASESNETQDNNVNEQEDQVKIFIKYQNPESSVKARAALDGRFFGGRKVSAEHYDRVLFRISDYSS